MGGYLQLRNHKEGEPNPIEWDGGILFVSCDIDKDKELHLKFDGIRTDSEDQQQLHLYLDEASVGDMVEQILREVAKNGTDYMRFVLGDALIQTRKLMIVDGEK